MCGIVGISGIEDAARLAYLGLYALQHRGQESAGIVAIDRGGQPRVHRGMGLVSDVFPDPVLAQLPDELRARLLGMIKTPATRIASVLAAPAGQVARVIGAYARKDEAA